MLSKINLEPIFDYLKATSIYKLFFTCLIIIVTTFLVATIYLSAANFDKIFNIINHPTTSKQLAEELENNIISNLKINHILSTLLEEVKGNRATLLKFHNGKSGLNGVAFLYYSATHQQIDKATSNSINQLQEIHLSIDPVGLEKLINRKCFIVYDTTDNLLLRNIMNSVGTKINIKCPIYSGVDYKNSFLIGFVSVSFTTETDITDDMLQIVKEYVTKLENTLDASS